MFKKSFSILCVIALFFLVTAPFSYGDDNDDIIETLDRHYQAISGRSFETAYNLRSNNWRLNHSYTYFYKNWENNYTIELVDRKVVSNDGYDAVVKVRIYSEDYNAKGKLHKAYYRGKAYMVYEKGKWKIDDIKVSEE